jgi:hypothetical protein
VDFGEERASTTSVVQAVYVDVVNVGGAPLTITSIAVTGTDQGDFAENDSCAGTSVGVTGRCVIDVRFTPLTTGMRSATLVITDNAPGSPQTIQLTGHG